ncbi:hypothetical protein [Vulgatibacter incomptus]|uniref:Choice-of-anchor D domain-containing protein n=1 Tax=Vulgatibacter incomptus TaxID=1391653 RepID=A0A0K1PDY4_9BACT|nr:hypothetical protein [Vulgatibacter incomptus]AKU91636.1 hypothetical protein AKJ08_2023 [Vulgatibacter incomptus]
MRRLYRLCLALFACGLVACGNQRTVTLPPAISVEADDGKKLDDLAFGKVPIEQSRTLSLVLHSLTVTSVEIASLHFESEDGVSAAAFSADPAGDFSVPGNRQTTVSIGFRPTEVRPYVAELVLATNDPKQASIRLPVRGEGIKGAIRVLACRADDKNDTCVGPEVEAPSSLDLGEVIAGRHVKARVKVRNVGYDTLEVRSIAFADGAAAAAVGFGLGEEATRVEVIPPGAGVTFHPTFDPPVGLEGEVGTTIVIASSDPQVPTVELPVVALVAPNRPPNACLTIREVRRQGRDPEPPGPGPVVIGPLDELVFDAAVRPGCTADPEDGEDIDTQWSLDGPDAFARLEPVSGAKLRRFFRAEVIGTYTVGLTAVDRVGLTSSTDEDGVPAVVSFEVRPQQAIAVEIRWPDSPFVDLDVHLVRGSPDKLWDTTDDCSWRNPMPPWGNSPPVTSPKLAIDDQGDGSLLETVWLNRPESGETYWVFAHFFEDRRGRDSAPRCTDSSSCGAGRVCSAGKCMPPVDVQARLFIEGEESFGLPGATRFEGPCDTWLLGGVRWRSTPGGAVDVLPTDAVYVDGQPVGGQCVQD